MAVINYSDGRAVPSVIVVWEDLHQERAGYFRAFWSDSPNGTTGSPVIGYCSPGGSHRTIAAVVREVSRMYPTEPVYRHGRLVSGWQVFNRRRQRFASFADAQTYASAVLARTGIVLGIERY